MALQTCEDIPLKPDEVRGLPQMGLDAANKTMEINSECVVQENYPFQVDSLLYTPQHGVR